MNCDEARQEFAEALQTGIESVTLQSHLEACPTCRAELAAARRTWASLDLLPVTEPGPAVRERFYQMLEAYQHGAQQSRVSLLDRLRSLWPKQPVWQIGIATGMLVIGVTLGHFSTARQQDQAQIAQLKEEVSNMRQLVALSLMQQQSANDRLKGVTWAYQVQRDDTEVLGALLETVNHDPNVNVRLAAIDALRNFGDSPVARKGVAQSLTKQSDPLVQVALVDLISELGIRQAVPTLKTLLTQEGLDENVKGRARRVLARFE